eukprot:s391_g23.t2
MSEELLGTDTVEELKADIVKLTEEQGRLEAECERRNAQKEELALQLEDALREETRNTEELKELRQKLQGVEEAKEEVDGKAASLRQQLQCAQAEGDMLSNELQKLGQQLQDSQAKAASLQEEPCLASSTQPASNATGAMPNAELSDRQCDHCGVVGALLQCGSCKQVAYCNFKCQRVAWKEHKPRCGLPAPAPGAPVAPAAPAAPSWAEHQARGERGQRLPRPQMGIQGAKPAKIEDFFDREDLDCGLAPLRDKKTAATSSRRDGREDRLNYSKWDNLADSDEDSKQKKSARLPPAASPGAKPPLFGQAMGMAPARQATKADTRTAAEKRAAAREALEEAEKLLHQVAGEVLYQAGFMGHGSVWELGPAAEKVARKCVRLLDSKVLPVLPNDQLAKFLYGSANFFLRRTMSCSEAEKHSFAGEAKALLLEVYRDAELSEEYRENACDFLAALLHEEGKPLQAEDVLKGLSLNSKENVPVTDAVGVSNGSNGSPNGTAKKYSKEPLRPSSSNGHDGYGTGNTHETKSDMNGKSNDKGIHGFSGPAARSAAGPWAWRRSRDAPMVPAPELTAEVKPPAEVKPVKEETSEKVYIPSIDDILARLDQEDEEEQAMR